MTTRTAIVFVYLAGEPDAVPAGELRLTQLGRDVTSLFIYGTRYLKRPNAIEIDPVSLAFHSTPRKPGEEITPSNGLSLFGGIRDAAPDSWGRRIIEKRLNAGGAELSEFTYLMEALDDRVGALDFRENQKSKSRHHPYNRIIQLDELIECAARIENDQPVSQELLLLFQYGGTMGGARPKAVVEDDDGLWIAKFPARDDRFNYPLVEHATLLMAQECGIHVPTIKLVNAGGRDVLLVKRFDRERVTTGGYSRKHFNSALTLLGKDETESLGTRYSEIVSAISKYAPAQSASDMKKQLFRQMVFNILVSNIDDHLRNFGFLSEGTHFSLSPAYDIVPTPAVGFERFQHLSVGEKGRLSTLDNALSECGVFGLSLSGARQLINDQLTIVENWKVRFEKSGVPVSEIEKIASAFRSREHLNWPQVAK